jgi:hypothetical protein
MAGMGSCNFLRVNDLGWGFLWREQTAFEAAATERVTECTKYQAYELDSLDPMWKAARAFSYLAIIVMVCATGVVLSLSCATLSKKYLYLLGALFWFAAIFEALTFLVYGADLCSGRESCALSFGAGITVGGIVTMILAGACLVAIPRATPRPSPSPLYGTSERSDNETHEEHHEEGEETGNFPDEAYDALTPADAEEHEEREVMKEDEIPVENSNVPDDERVPSA